MNTAARDRRLLQSGLVVGPLYFAVSLAQAAVREGFDLTRHPLSALANGSGGWVQTLNLVLSGVLVIAAAVGIRRALTPRARAATWAMSGFGLGMMIAAAFPMDPSDGFPAGTPLGMPTSISTSGIVHFAAGGIGFMSLAVACLLLGIAMRGVWSRAAVALSITAGIAIPAFFFAGMTPAVGIAGIWLSVIVQFAWIGAASWDILSRLAEH